MDMDQKQKIAELQTRLLLQKQQLSFLQQKNHQTLQQLLDQPQQCVQILQKNQELLLRHSPQPPKKPLKSSQHLTQKLYREGIQQKLDKICHEIDNIIGNDALEQRNRIDLYKNDSIEEYKRMIDAEKEEKFREEERKIRGEILGLGKELGVDLCMGKFG